MPFTLRFDIVGSSNMHVALANKATSLSVWNFLPDRCALGTAFNSRVAGTPPGSQRAVRDRLRSYGSCHPDHQAPATHCPCANMRGRRAPSPCVTESRHTHRLARRLLVCRGAG